MIKSSSSSFNALDVLFGSFLNHCKRTASPTFTKVYLVLATVRDNEPKKSKINRMEFLEAFIFT